MRRAWLDGHGRRPGLHRRRLDSGERRLDSNGRRLDSSGRWFDTDGRRRRGRLRNRSCDRRGRWCRRRGRLRIRSRRRDHLLAKLVQPTRDRVERTLLLSDRFLEEIQTAAQACHPDQADQRQHERDGGEEEEKREHALGTSAPEARSDSRSGTNCPRLHGMAVNREIG